MRTSTVLVLGGVGLAGFLLWRYLQQQATAQAAAIVIPPGTSPLDALTTGLQAGINAGTYDAQALRMGTQPVNFGPGQTSISGFGRG